jgi:hypothetical protein
MEPLTPEACLNFTEPTSDFLCPLSANEFGIEFLYFKVRDLDSGQTIVEILKSELDQPPIDDQQRLIRLHFGPEFLQLRTIGTTVEFKVGPRPVVDLRMIERHYFKSVLLKSFDLTLNFCIPNSINSWEIIYDVPEISPEVLANMLTSPWETKSDSFYFVQDTLTMHSRAEYNYSPFV